MIERNSSAGISESPFACAAATIGRSQRMLAAALQAGDQTDHAVLGLAADGDHRDQLRLALRERAGLVERQGVDFLQRLQRFGVLDENAGACAASGADHDRHRRRQPERARASDDQHRDGIDDGIAPDAARGLSRTRRRT